MKKHYVTFYSPGTFVSENSTKEIESWDVEKAKEMALGITERYGATPYGFSFFTKERGENDFEPKVTEKSKFYHLGGEIWTLEELKERNDPDDKILISNMGCNNWDKVVINNNSWRHTELFNEGDTLLEFDLSLLHPQEGSKA